MTSRRATWSITPATSCGCCASGRARRSSATSRTGSTIRELVGDEEKASELEIRLEQTVENRNSHYVDHLRFVLEEAGRGSPAGVRAS